MKILYLHQYFNTPEMPGSTRSYEFAKRLVNRGDTVYMVTTNWQSKSNLSYTLVEGIHVYWAPISYNNKMSYLMRIIVFIRFLWYILALGWKINFDLIIASSTPLTISLPSILLKKIKNAKMIFEVRDLWPQLPIAMGAIKSKLVINLAKWLEKTTYNNSNHIICLSSGMKDELSLITSNNKITIVTNLCDISGFKKQQDKSEIKIPITRNNPLILYTGAFGRINGVIYLIEIAKEMRMINPDVFFLLAGDGYEKKKIIETSKEYGLYNSTVLCIDYVPKDQIPKLLSMATIVTSLFIDLPEMENNSANKFFDGLAAGKPIMINYGGWQADLLSKMSCGFIIPPNDAINSAKKINDIITDKSKLSQMSKASINLAHKFDIETNYNKFVDVIDNVMFSEKIG